MNNQHLAEDQFLTLQNISYVKQFMQKGSIKLLFIVSLLSAFVSSLFLYSFKDLYEMIFEFTQATSGIVINPDESLLFTQTINMSLTVGSIATLVTNLILPISLLYIIIRSKSENPTVIPLGTIKFLYVISFIQSIFVVSSSVITVLLEILGIFNAESILEAIISTLIGAASLFFYSLFFVLQTKFLKALKHSCTGYSLIYGSSKGFGVMSVLNAIITGVSSAVTIVFAVVFYALLSSNSFESNESLEIFLAMGGLELLDTLKPTAIIFIVLSLLATIYYALLASIAFSYKEMVEVVVRESFMSSRRTNINTSSAFRTYGGSNSFTNYNYSASGSSSQQSYAHTMNTNQNNPINTTPEVNNEIAPEAPINDYNPYNNAPQQYDEPFTGNGSFTPTQPVVNNNINDEPFATNGSFGSGSFGFQEDSNNNY